MKDDRSSFWQRTVHVVGTKLGLHRLLGTTYGAGNADWFSVEEGDDAPYKKSLLDESDKLPTTEDSPRRKWEDEVELDENVGTSSFLQATMNTVAVLFGMGMLALPYAVEQGGWSSLIMLLIFAIMSCYTACILGICMKENNLLTTYQDIVRSAIGLRGRLIFTVFLYLEILACLVGFTISVGDNLAQIFPGAGLSWVDVRPTTFLVSIAMLVVAPTVLMRDLSYVAYLSFGGVFTSIIVVGAVTWTGITEVGFSEAVPFARPERWRFVLGLYAYCYSGHPVIPSIYTSMRDRSKFPSMVILSFIIATSIYAGLALIGAAMFGEDTLPQITLNIPTNLTAAAVVLWTTVLTPLSKFSLGITPIALDLESLLPFQAASKSHWASGSVIRLCILLLIVAVAVAFPFFGTTLDFVGSSISIAMSIIFPCILDIILHWRTMSKIRVVVDVVITLVATGFAVVGTLSSSMVLV